MTTPRLRTARADEAAAILALWQRADAVPTATDDIGAVEALLASPQADVIVAEGDAGLVASIVATWDGWRGHLYRLAVLPELRRKGLASTLVDEAERRLRERGAIRVLAIVMADDDRAASFWNATGYREQPDVARYAKRVVDR